MIERINWAGSGLGNKNCPFSCGNVDRPLRITFHTSSFEGAPLEEEEAIRALRELSNLPEIEALDTEEGTLPYIKIEAIQDSENGIPLTVHSDRGLTYSYIPHLQQLRRSASALARKAKLSKFDIDVVLNDLIVAEAHYQRRQDILVTRSIHILNNRRKHLSRYVNPRTPIEAAKIVGLFLRSRENYTWKAGKNFSKRFDRGLFYLILSRHRLPNMWKYLSACVAAEKFRDDNIRELGQSILLRCVRAIEARDAIGAQFYIPQNNITRDIIMYHFDYLTLLLAGALDAQSRVAHRAYRINRPKERYTGFRKNDFIKALGDNEAKELYDIISSQSFEDLMTLLYELRNTIHSAAMKSFVSGRKNRLEYSFIKVLPEHKELLWHTAERYSSPKKWGLIKIHDDIRMEPYIYAVTLVSECFKFIDAIASATEITRLFPDAVSIPILREKAPEDNIYGENIRRRLEILG